MVNKTSIDTSLVLTQTYNDMPITKEATTSRVLVNNDLLRHVMFALDSGQVLTEHSSPRAVIVNILSGKLTFTISGTTHTVVQGDVIYLAPNEPHALEAQEPTYMSLTLIDVEKGHAQ